MTNHLTEHTYLPIYGDPDDILIEAGYALQG